VCYVADLAIDLLVERVIPLIDIPKAGGLGSSTKLAVQFLLHVPIETLTRSQRETAMKALVSCFSKDLNKVEGHGPDYWKPALSLMVKLMGRPTFYEVRNQRSLFFCVLLTLLQDMSFSHLEAIGRCLWKAHHLSALALASGDITEDRYNFQLLQQLAGLTIRYVIHSLFGT
jgi:nucleolar pre-ribosomal-associated protein 2